MNIYLDHYTDIKSYKPYGMRYIDDENIIFTLNWEGGWQKLALVKVNVIDEIFKLHKKHK